MHSSREQFPTFQLAPPDNRIITWDQFQGLIHACVKHQITTDVHPKSEFKRFGEWVPRVDIWDDQESPTVIATFELPGVLHSRHVGHEIKHFVDDISGLESSRGTRDTTWARKKKGDGRRVANTMGYQVDKKG
ncbi:hypothetical protein K435DRAFT_866800 [Dendrothele bispora CBS 962.96]|uniref:Uncharacterized protein n=1 Tax=Dendrothele bispora (strain CBS 962.96) TaxID=1314807 RepID=A0A4S8LFU4_DENBC|nr:hypothetical protein K435DRAFT_866800 [Dendrothele bispora CBS 962.96]